MRWRGSAGSRCCSKAPILVIPTSRWRWPDAGLSAAIKILVIKLAALGDVVQAMGAASAIRAFHADAQITVLTTRPYAELLRQAPYFDEVWVDERPDWGDPIG